MTVSPHPKSFLFLSFAETEIVSKEKRSAGDEYKLLEQKHQMIQSSPLLSCDIGENSNPPP
jgi:hypothetical protein